MRALRVRCAVSLVFSCLAVLGCIKDARKEAMSAAQSRAQIELQCPVLTSAVESEQGVPGGHRYQVGVQGCGGYRVYPMLCQTGGSCRFEPTEATPPASSSAP